jgi:hypothetical protein
MEGKDIRLEREVGTQASFYEPWEIGGIRIWLDAVDDIFRFMRETHSPCRLQENCSHSLPARRQVRLAVQDVTARICPETVHPWCPLPKGCLRIEDGYRGEDCWMGAYDGVSAHGGLDVNHPAGPPSILQSIWTINSCTIQWKWDILTIGGVVYGNGKTRQRGF